MLPVKILNKHMGRKKGHIITEFLVQWHGLPDEEAKWVPLFKFQQQFPTFEMQDP